MMQDSINQELISLNLTETELGVIKRELSSYRYHEKLRLEREEKQRSCEHNWVYNGRFEGTDEQICAKCYKCEVTK
jgi:hypothetical protein